jgi:SAM-dependent methyltransferase
MSVIPDAVGIPADRVVLKVRRRQKGLAQYERQAATGQFRTVHEGGLRFLVNLTDYLDTGLFLDHRPTRALIRGLAPGGRFLNLFAYTGTASVYAAAGGAASTTTVDMSAVYLDWARRNMGLNGFAEGRVHRFVRADCLAWLATPHPERYHVIFLDPPTFSNSKRMGESTFEVQRDHVALINAAARLLARDGVLLFSNNFRHFKMYHTALPDLAAEDISRATLSLDFHRNPKIHTCWRITEDQGSIRVRRLSWRASNSTRAARMVLQCAHRVVEVPAVASSQRDRDRDGRIPAGAQDQFVAAAKTPVRETETTQPVAFVRIGTGQVEDETWLEFDEQPGNCRRQRAEIFVVPRAVRKGDVQRARDFAERIVVVAMDGEGEDVRFAREDGCGPVPLMDIAIDEAMRCTQASCKVEWRSRCRSGRTSPRSETRGAPPARLAATASRMAIRAALSVPCTEACDRRTSDSDQGRPKRRIAAVVGPRQLFPIVLGVDPQISRGSANVGSRSSSADRSSANSRSRIRRYFWMGKR